MVDDQRNSLEIRTDYLKRQFLIRPVPGKAKSTLMRAIGAKDFMFILLASGEALELGISELSSVKQPLKYFTQDKLYTPETIAEVAKTLPKGLFPVYLRMFGKVYLTFTNKDNFPLLESHIAELGFEGAKGLSMKKKQETLKDSKSIRLIRTLGDILSSAHAVHNNPRQFPGKLRPKVTRMSAAIATLRARQALIERSRSFARRIPLVGNAIERRLPKTPRK